MQTLRIIMPGAIAAVLATATDAVDATENCRFRVAAIRAEIAAKPDRSDLVSELAAAEKLCKLGEIDEAIAMLSDIVARLRSDG